jgi:abequosyltransferase
LKEPSKIRLSVCIPTINRADFIGATLESIVSQSSDEVEIVIVDGSSNDATREVVAYFQKRFASIRYFQEDQKSSANSSLPSSAGFDRDCSRSVELALGEYCWLFTDDDLLRPGAIETILKATRQQYESIIVNAEVRSHLLSEVLEPARLHLSADRVYGPMETEKLFADVADYVSFVGAVVVRKQFWMGRHKGHYLGTGLIHVGVLFQGTIHGQVLVMAEPLITIRYGNALYMLSPRSFEIWMFVWPELIWSFGHFSDAAKLQVCRKEPWRRFRTLLAYRAIGVFSTAEYTRWLEGRMSSPWQRLAARLAASFPGRAANLIGVIRFHLSPRLPRQFLVNLVNSPFYFARILTKARTSSGGKL